MIYLKIRWSQKIYEKNSRQKLENSHLKKRKEIHDYSTSRKFQQFALTSDIQAVFTALCCFLIHFYCEIQTVNLQNEILVSLYLLYAVGNYRFKKLDKYSKLVLILRFYKVLYLIFLTKSLQGSLKNVNFFPYSKINERSFGVPSKIEFLLKIGS